MDLFSYMFETHNINFNEQQQNAITHFENPALVLAVPGAGKTTVLMTRTAHLLINHNVKSNQILSLTFSKAAALDMQKKFDSLFESLNLGKITFSTIHSFAFKIIREYAYREHLNLNLIEGNDSSPNKVDILKMIYRQITNTNITDDKLEELISQISLVKNKCISPSNPEFSNILHFEQIFKTYEQIKKSNQYIDFDDMLLLALKILSSNHIVAIKYKQLYSFLQIDEAQDTSLVQHKIIKELLARHKNLFMVADDDQSIYGFRGASPSELLSFEKTYKNSSIYFMEQNYRSTKDIVDSSNQIIVKNKNRYPKKIKTDSKHKNPVDFKQFKTEKFQLQYISDQLDCNLDNSNCAILSRTNLSLIPIANALISSNKSFQMKDSKLNFFSHWVIKDFTSFILLALNPLDLKAFEKIYYKMNAYISKEHLHFLEKHPSDISIFDSLTKFEKLKSFQKERMLSLKHKFKRLSKLEPFKAISFIENDLNYLEYVKEHCEKFGTSFDHVSKYISIFKLISQNQDSLNSFLLHIALLRKKLRQKNTNSNIYLSTIHSAKGLEFDQVFMIDLIDGEFPGQSALDSYQRGILSDIEEERRLFYVGMTRAKKALHLLTYSSLNGKLVSPSMFLSELQLSKCDSNMELFSEDQQVEHKIFNKGKIISINGDIITVYFEGHGVKKLSSSLSLENNLIKFL